MAAAACPGCLKRDERIAALEHRVAELEARLGANATNSGTPPSANPPAAPKPVVKTPTGRQPGAQPGHEPYLRRRLPPERIAEVIDFRPQRCHGCHATLPERPGPNDPEPTWHQVAELPPLAARVTEYRGHARTCPRCGTLNHAPLPAELRRHSVGPRLTAFLAYLAGCHHVSTRGLEELAEDAFGVPLALGTVSRLQSQVSEALMAAHAEAVAVVRQAPVKHVDETGWKLAGKLCWLWGGRLDGVVGRRDSRHPVQRPLERLRPAAGRAAAGLLGAPGPRLPAVYGARPDGTAGWRSRLAGGRSVVPGVAPVPGRGYHPTGVVPTPGPGRGGTP